MQTCKLPYYKECFFYCSKLFGAVLQQIIDFFASFLQLTDHSALLLTLPMVLNVCAVNGARYQQLATKLGIKPRLLPALVLLDVANETQFVYPPTLPLTQDEVFAFSTRVLAGEEVATLRSAAECFPCPTCLCCVATL